MILKIPVSGHGLLFHSDFSNASSGKFLPHIFIIFDRFKLIEFQKLFLIANGSLVSNEQPLSTLIRMTIINNNIQGPALE